MRVLITRPIDDAEETASALRARGHDPIVAPLLAVRFHDGHPLHLDDVGALLFTSANGVRALARRTSRRDFMVFAVGSQTAQAARDAGFAEVRNADGNARDLAALVGQTFEPQTGVLLHAAGAEAQARLAAALTDAGFTVRTEVLYDVPVADALPDAARAALAGGTAGAVLLYSARSAQAFVALVSQAGLRQVCESLLACCISEAAAAPLAGLPLKEIRIAPRPNQEALIACLG